VKFWDSSAIVPLLVEEPATRRLNAIAANDPAMVVWWASEVECVSAVARRERDGTIEPQEVMLALNHLRELAATWYVIDPNEQIRETAIRLVRAHALRAADALQLAAALLNAQGRPSSLELLVTLDDRLAAAARKEGFIVSDRLSLN
jgi:predicted nucleic acid-binding protein